MEEDVVLSHFVIVELVGLLVLLVTLWVTSRWTQGRFSPEFSVFLQANNQEQAVSLEREASNAYQAEVQRLRQMRQLPPDQIPWINGKAGEVLQEALARHTAGASLRISVDRGAPANKEFQVQGPGLPQTVAAASTANHLSLELTNNGPHVCKAVKTVIGKLDVMAEAASVELEECWVRAVTLSSTPEFRARGCIIGQLNIHSNGIRLLELRSCVIGRINMAGDRPPAVATISADTELAAEPNRDREVIPQRVQAYRTLRLALKDHRCDEVTEKIIHAAELRLERGEDAQPFRLLSYLFDLSSHYGNRPHRALGFILVIWFALFIWAGGLPWTDVPSDCALAVNRYEGWLGVLCEKSAWGNAGRGAIVVAQALTNPFGLFSSKPLVVPETFTAAALLAVFSLVGLVLLTVAIIGVRRRFKVN